MTGQFLRLTFTFTLGLMATTSFAQPFEAVYGPAGTIDQGARRVKPVVYCPNGGFITVGTTDRDGAGADIYLVRTNNLGVPFWEMTYDPQAAGQQDEGRALVELPDGSGFVILGNTYTNVWNVVLMKVNCDGQPQWTRLYSHTLADRHLIGADLLRASSGAAAQRTAIGDLVVAGLTHLADPEVFVADALLFRTTAAGMLIWNQTYDTNSNEQFRGVTDPGAALGVAGDLVAVGEVGLGNRQGLVLRVNGNNGLVGAAPQCAAAYGGIYPESFSAATELRVGARARELALVGWSQAGVQPWDDLFLVRTQANPCLRLAQATIGGGPGEDPLNPYREGATDVRELRTALDPILQAPVGSLALTGFAHATTPGQNADAFLLLVNPLNFNPLAGRLYGDHGAQMEVGLSLERIVAPNSQAVGFVMAGYSNANWEGVADPQDLYLLATDGKLHTGCEVDWDPDKVDHTWEQQVLSPQVAQPVVEASLLPNWEAIDTHFGICP